MLQLPLWRFGVERKLGNLILIFFFAGVGLVMMIKIKLEGLLKLFQKEKINLKVKYYKLNVKRKKKNDLVNQRISDWNSASYA